MVGVLPTYVILLTQQKIFDANLYWWASLLCYYRYLSANPDTDKSELQAIEEVFCKQRTEPLLVGSVTSNIGFTDAASGLNGIIKVT